MVVSASRNLGPEDVLGQRIQSVWGLWGSTGAGEWLDTAGAWLVLENGMVVALPSSEMKEWSTSSIPLGARLLEGSRDGMLWDLIARLRSLLKIELRETSASVVGSRIRAVYRAMSEGEIEAGESVILELFDGRVITFNSVAPHGTGSVGLFVEDELSLDPPDTVAPFWPEGQSESGTEAGEND